MRIIENHNNIINTNRLNHLKFLEHLEILKPNRFTPSIHRKIIELCQTQKFVEILDTNTYIKVVDESPDFILNYQGNNIGLEHELLLDSKLKDKEGFYENLCQIVEERFYNESHSELFLAVIYFNKDFQYSTHKKNEYINNIYHKILNKHQSNIFHKDEMINRIDIQPHCHINVYANFGAWTQSWITPENLEKAIKKKEAKIEEYISKTGLPQWLLIVAAVGYNSSLAIKFPFDLKIESKFDRIFILEDSGNKLYEI